MITILNSVGKYDHVDYIRHKLLSVPKQKNRNFCDNINTTFRRAEGQKAEEEERLRELGYSVAGQKIRKNYKNIAKLLQKIRKKYVADFKNIVADCGKIWILYVAG